MAQHQNMTAPKQGGYALTVALLLTLGLSGNAASEKPNATVSPSLVDITFVAFDTETTGLKASENRIVEIGAVKFKGGHVLDRKGWLINPGIPIPVAAQNIHGITSAMVSNCPPFATVFSDFAAFSKDAVLLAHNAKFDRRFVAAELDRHALNCPTNLLLDTMMLCRRWYPELRSYSLESLTRTLVSCLINETSTNAGEACATNRANRFHSALWDAECAAALFMKGSTTLPTDATLTDLTNAAGEVLSFKSSSPESRGPAILHP